MEASGEMKNPPTASAIGGWKIMMPILLLRVLGSAWADESLSGGRTFAAGRAAAGVRGRGLGRALGLGISGLGGESLGISGVQGTRQHQGCRDQGKGLFHYEAFFLPCLWCFLWWCLLCFLPTTEWVTVAACDSVVSKGVQAKAASVRIRTNFFISLFRT